MDVVGQERTTEIVDFSAARMGVARMGIHGSGRLAAPALAAELAALLLAHRIEMEIDVCELFDAQLRGSAPPVLDARVSRAYRAGHIPEAIHMPADSVSRAALLALPPSPCIIVYGSDALRLEAVRTAQAVAEMGFAVKLLNGGFSAWVEQGFPTDLPAPSDSRMAAL